MLLIIILILSQDKGFSQNMQEVMLGSVPWYKERMLQKTSLGDLSQFIFLLQLAAAYMFNYAFQSPMLSVCHNPKETKHLAQLSWQSATCMLFAQQSMFLYHMSVDTQAVDARKASQHKKQLTHRYSVSML